MPDLLNKISTDLAADSTTPVAEDTELLMSGLVDSLGIMTLVTWIEDQIGSEIDPGDVVFENFESPAAILAFTTRLTAATPS